MRVIYFENGSAELIVKLCNIEQMLVEEKDADDCIYSLPGASARVADSNLLQQQPSIVDLTSPVKPTPCSFKTNELNLIDISNSVSSA